MTEEKFLKGLAEEVAKRDDKRLQDLLAWCRHVVTTMKSCDDEPQNQELHAAGVAASLLAEVNYMEETGVATHDQPHLSFLSINDPQWAYYCYQVDNRARTVTISVRVVLQATGQRVPHWNFEPIVLPMRNEAE